MSALLELRGVEKRYGTKASPLVVLNGIDLSVQEGEFVSISGPSGSGKSTLLNIMGCLDRPSSGRYTFSGTEVGGLDDKRLSRLRNAHIGFVFQSFQLISHLTVLENVELPLFYARVPRRQRRPRCEELLEQVGLSHRVGHLPSELSGGEMQRTAIARALTNDPGVLLADEPTGNLDSAISQEILEHFTRLHESGRTIVMITHEREIAAAAPRRITMRDGRIEADERTATPDPEESSCSSS